MRWACGERGLTRKARRVGGVRLVRWGWQAHSVRRESCNSDSSPEPSAACTERGLCERQGWVGGVLGGMAGGGRWACEDNAVGDATLIGLWICFGVDRG